jgi:hypothetical protein
MLFFYQKQGTNVPVEARHQILYGGWSLQKKDMELALFLGLPAPHLQFFCCLCSPFGLNTYALQKVKGRFLAVYVDLYCYIITL